MGKGRDKRKHKFRKQKPPQPAAPGPQHADPPMSDEPDAVVYASLNPKPRPRSGAAALPEPDVEEPFVVVKPRGGS